MSFPWKAAAGLDPSNGDRAEKQIRFYRVAGAPGFPGTHGHPAFVLTPMAKGYWNLMAGVFRSVSATTWLLPRSGRPWEPPSAVKQREPAGNIVFHRSSPRVSKKPDFGQYFLSGFWTRGHFFCLNGKFSFSTTG